ncbi:MAG: hypothetical protein KF819_05095 [Labilithrix sp.]|nr:hypothetical protein [Labilithrix sp.]
MHDRSPARAACRAEDMRIGVLLASLCLAGCGSAKTSGFEQAPPGGGNGFGDGQQGQLGGAKPAPSDGNQTGCSEAAKLVYVVSDGNELYSFAPDKVTFSRIGTLRCPSGGATPNSMAIDRAGTAWVNFSDGALFKVSTADASCEATTFQKGQSGFERFGMAFATNSASTSDETLFVVGIDGPGQGKGLAKIDLSTMKLTLLGDFSGNLEGTAAELTGTGDGRLFGFFTTVPYATLAQIDMASGATNGERDLGGVSTGNAWAFSFWGGDFWFYTSTGLAPSTVTRLKASSDNSISTAKQNVGNFRIVGAGVSTCAPTAPPR